MQMTRLVHANARSNRENRGGGCPTCSNPSGPGRVSPGLGNLTIRTTLPSSDAFSAPVGLSYRGKGGEVTEFGSNWTNNYLQEVVDLGSNLADVIKEDGAIFRYTDSDQDGTYAPPEGAVNTLVKNGDNTWTETSPAGFEWHYDSTGILTKMQTAKGDIWTLSWDATTTLLNYVADPNNKRTTFTYSNDYIRRIEDSAGRITTYSVNGDDNLEQITAPDGDITQMLYDNQSRLTTWIAPDGLRTSYSYDVQDRVTEVQAADGGRITYIYDTNGSTTIDPRGYRTTYVLNGNDQVHYQSDPLGNRTTFSYDDGGSLIAVQRPLDPPTSFVNGTLSNCTLGDHAARAIRS